jgi:outer membrane protein assembly factor BamB
MRLDKPKAWERILCFKESTGKLLWSREYELVYPEFCFNPEQGGGPAATLIVEAGKVYWQGRSGQVECLDARSGKVIWEIHLDTKYTVGILSVRSSPLIEGNLLILFAGARPGGVCHRARQADGKGSLEGVG